jgi:hypothetical protein
MSDQVVNNTQEVNVEVDLAPEAHEDVGALNFDELDTLTDGRSNEKVFSEAKKESKTETKKNESKSKREDHDEEAEKGPEAEEGEEGLLQQEIKRILAKQGEEDLELAANTLFRHKVDGEEVDVDLQELLNNYSGKVSYDKKFQEFSNTKKDFESYKKDYDGQINTINGYINNFAEKMRNNDAMGALEYFAEFAGMKPHEFRRELLNQMIPQVERMRQMSPDQLRAEELEMQNAYLQQQQESAQKRLSNEQAIKELENEIANVQEAHQISDEDFKQSYEDLLEYEYEGEITPAVVADYYLNSQAFSKAESILESISPALSAEDHIVETFQKVIVENPSFDDNDLMEIVQDVYGDFIKKASKTVSKKADAPKKQETKVSQSKETYMDWEDL